MIVYSAIYGGSDAIKPLLPEVRGVMFTDYPSLRNETHWDGWEIRYEPLSHLGSPRTKAKLWKVRPDLADLGNHTTLWLDGSMQLLPGGLEAAEAALGDNEAAFFRHHVRDCVYEEVPASYGGRPLAYAAQPLGSQVESYRRRGLPEHAGLIASGCMIRRDTPWVREFNRLWWDENCRWSTQDQLSATWALFQSDDAGRWRYLPWLMISHDQPIMFLHQHTKENA